MKLFSLDCVKAASVYRKDLCYSYTFASSGYSREEILGCNCRVLNGPGTSLEALEEVWTRILQLVWPHSLSYCLLFIQFPFEIGCTDKSTYLFWAGMYSGSTMLQVCWHVFVLVAKRFSLCKEPNRNFTAPTFYQERWKFVPWSSPCISYQRCFRQGSLTSFSGSSEWLCFYRFCVLYPCFCRALKQNELAVYTPS